MEHVERQDEREEELRADADELEQRGDELETKAGELDEKVEHVREEFQRRRESSDAPGIRPDDEDVTGEPPGDDAPAGDEDE